MINKELIFEVLQAKYMMNYNITDLSKAFDLKWICSKNIDLKIEVLIEALNKNIKVNEVSKYKDIIKEPIEIYDDAIREDIEDNNDIEVL